MTAAQVVQCAGRRLSSVSVRVDWMVALACDCDEWEMQGGEGVCAVACSLRDVDLESEGCLATGRFDIGPLYQYCPLRQCP